MDKLKPNKAKLDSEAVAMTAWAAEELKYAELGDVRRNRRLIRLVSDLAAQPNTSVPLFIGRLGSYPSGV